MPRLAEQYLEKPGSKSTFKLPLKDNYFEEAGASQVGFFKPKGETIPTILLGTFDRIGYEYGTISD